MRMILVLSLLFLSKIAVSQHIPQFELTKEGVEPIVVIVDSLNAPELYNKTLNWIQEYYKNPSEVLKVDVKNQKLSIEDIKNHAWTYRIPDTTYYYDVEYIFTMNIEDKQITMSFDFGNTWNQSEQFVKHSYCINYTKLWKENGEVHSIYKETKSGIDQMMNELSLSLITHLRQDKINLVEEKQSDWLKLRHKPKSKVVY